jgi:hypothetical protein
MLRMVPALGYYQSSLRDGKRHVQYDERYLSNRTLVRGQIILGHSFTSSLFHCVFSTKERRPFITEGLRLRLWPYMGGIARDNHMKALSIGGVEDHVHILLSLPSTMAVAKAIQIIKGGSSLWVHEG